MSDTIRHVETPMGRIAYAERGSGPPALFVHGVFLNHRLWRHVVGRVADLRRCIAIDLLGHGATETAADQDLSFAAQAEMLEAVCVMLRLEQVDLVANDSGGGIAQIFAARHPGRIRSLTLTNCDTHDNWPPPPFVPMVAIARSGRLAERVGRMAEDVGFARTVFATAFEHVEQVSAETFRLYLEPVFRTEAAVRLLERFIAGQDCRQTVAIAPLLRRLEAPTQIVWGTDDIFFPVKWAYWLHGAIPGSRRVVELAGARLFFPEERPDALADALRAHWVAA
jgi:pimeloyl-ACP methyl ester carboxylesterase